VTALAPVAERTGPARLVFLVAAPLAYAALLLFHPIPDHGPVLHGIDHALDRWTVVHVAQLGFIGAMGGALLWLVHGLTGRAAAVARVSAVVFVLAYGAYESWTGIGTGSLIATASGLPDADQHAMSVVVQAHWDSPVLGNVSVGGIAGAGAWLAGTAAAAAALRRVGASTATVVCLVASGLLFAPTHVPPFGPIAMVLFAAAVLQLERTGRKDA
jgi:hypothetical protein